MKRIYIINYIDDFDRQRKIEMISSILNKEDYSVYFGVSITVEPNFKLKITITPNGIIHMNPTIIDVFLSDVNDSLSLI